MEHSTSQPKFLTDRPLKEVIEEAADKVRERNKRMAGPLVVSEPKPISSAINPR